MTYDGANRRIQEVDALGNMVDYLLDAGGNIVLTTRTEKCTITEPTVEDEIFRTAIAYDALGRLVLSAEQGADGLLSTAVYPCGSDAIWPVQPSALISRFGYDSRGNQTLVIDPKFNTSITVCDGASRTVQTQQHLRDKGEGTNPPEANQTFLPSGSGCITTTMTLDGNGRLRQLVDDRGSPTRFTYDTLDRETVMTFQDNSTRERTYDTAGDAVEYKDENGSVFTNTFDALGRKTAVSISLASGVIGTTAQSFQYDGLSRNTYARDSVSSTHADVTFVFDSLNRSLEESQEYGGNTRDVTNSEFTSYPATEFTFPDDRRITNTYDLLYRRTLVEEPSGGTDIAAWQFFGPSRVAEVTLGYVPLVQSFMNNARTHSAVQPGVSNPDWGDRTSDRLGYDGSGRPITKRFLFGSYTTAIVGFTTAYDKSSNKLYERALQAEDRGHLYQPFSAENQPTGGYDSLNRLRQYQRGTLSSTGGPGNVGGGSLTSPINLPNTNESARYELDGLGNWRRFITDPVGGSETTQVRQHNGLNEITRVDSTPFAYDGAPGASNGNLANDGTLKYEWDALNRLKLVKRVSDDAMIGTYTYDAMNRRIRKVVSNGGLSGTIPNGTTDCLYQGWRCVEDRDGSNTPLKQYLWGIYLDELIQMNLLVSENDLPTGGYYVVQDLLYRTAALIRDVAVLEAYDYDAYGNTLIFRHSFPPGITWTNSDTQVDNPTCPFLFTGQRYDAESTNYYYKERYYSPKWGRFLSQDPINYAGGINLLEYVASSPAVSIDSRGTKGATIFFTWQEPGDPGPVVTGTVVFTTTEDCKEKTTEDCSGPQTNCTGDIAIDSVSFTATHRGRNSDEFENGVIGFQLHACGQSAPLKLTPKQPTLPAKATATVKCKGQPTVSCKGGQLSVNAGITPSKDPKVTEGGLEFIFVLGITSCGRISSTVTGNRLYSDLKSHEVTTDTTMQHK